MSESRLCQGCGMEHIDPAQAERSKAIREGLQRQADRLAEEAERASAASPSGFVGINAAGRIVPLEEAGHGGRDEGTEGL